MHVGGREGAYVVLCPAHLPVVAFADAPPVQGCPVAVFVSAPRWAQCFADVGLRLLDVPELSTPMGEVDPGEPAEAELAQVRYWRPELLGVLLSNRWDSVRDPAVIRPGTPVGRPRPRP